MRVWVVRGPPNIRTHTVHDKHKKKLKPNTIHIFSPKRDEREGGACEDTGLGCTAHDQERERAPYFDGALEHTEKQKSGVHTVGFFHRA